MASGGEARNGDDVFPHPFSFPSRARFPHLRGGCAERQRALALHGVEQRRREAQARVAAVVAVDAVADGGRGGDTHRDNENVEERHSEARVCREAP
jgi:hypothetical protein